MSNLNWYYFVKSQRHGPITSLELIELVKTGQLAANDMVWREGLDDWVPARSVKGLFDHLQMPTPAMNASPPPQPATMSYGDNAAPYLAPSSREALATFPAASPAHSPNGGASASATVSVAILTHPLASPSSEQKNYKAMALTSMIIALAGVLLFGFITGVLAVIFAAIALSGMGKTGDTDGKGMAIAGLVIGIIDVISSWFIFVAIFS